MVKKYDGDHQSGNFAGRAEKWAGQSAAPMSEYRKRRGARKTKKVTVVRKQERSGEGTTKKARTSQTKEEGCFVCDKECGHSNLRMPLGLILKNHIVCTWKWWRRWRFAAWRRRSLAPARSGRFRQAAERNSWPSTSKYSEPSWLVMNAMKLINRREEAYEQRERFYKRQVHMPTHMDAALYLSFWRTASKLLLRAQKKQFKRTSRLTYLVVEEQARKSDHHFPELNVVHQLERA